jgi:hypothetical protein
VKTLTSDNLQSIMDVLAAKKTAWAATNTAERRALLSRLRASTYLAAPHWAEVCCQIKGLDPKSALAGEEWAMGPMVTLRNLRLLEEGFDQPARAPKPVHQTFPGELYDRFQWPGISGETWEQPEHLRNPLLKPAHGVVSLVLGAGNVSSISATDVLYKLFVQNQVVLLKMNPVHEKLGPVLEEAFLPLIEWGALAIVSGDGAAGALACQHPEVENIHVTGSHHTYHSIYKQLKSANCPKLITAELGCVSPVIVVPGVWSERDLNYQARHVAGMLTTNAGFNCNAAQVLITCRRWPQREAFLQALSKALAAVPTRPAYYPGAMDRYEGFCQAYPQAQKLGKSQPGCIPWTLISGLDEQSSKKALQEEAFCGVLHELSLDLSDPEFLLGACDFANKNIWGNLSATILIHPSSKLRHPWKEAVKSLRYGAVGVNLWPGLVFALVNLPWGAYPGNHPADIQSGVGIVHNTANVDSPEKAVLQGPFWTPYKPPWHAGNRRLLQIGQALTRYEYQPGLMRLLAVHYNVLRGTLL